MKKNTHDVSSPANVGENCCSISAQKTTKQIRFVTTRTRKCTRCTMQMRYSVRFRLALPSLSQTRQTSRKNKKLSKKVLVMIKHHLVNLTRTFTRTTSRRVACERRRISGCHCFRLAGERILFIHSANLKKFSILKNTPFPLNQCIKVHRRALVLLLYLIPCHRCKT